MSKDLFDELTGSIKREIDEKSERLGALDEKHAGIYAFANSLQIKKD